MTDEAEEMRESLHAFHIPHYLEELFESTLVAERHATVERIRIGLLNLGYASGYSTYGETTFDWEDINALLGASR